MAADTDSGREKRVAEALTGTEETIRFRYLVRICALLIAGIGLLALLGWVLGLPFLASLGSGKIPVAPSTAVLFVLYGVMIFLRTHLSSRRWAYWTGLFINSAGASVALILLVLSYQGIHPEVEHPGIVIVHAAGETPVGHMSPVTALCFLLASLSFLASRTSSPDRHWRAAVAWWLACLLMTMSFVLLLAYLYGVPLLYGSPFIPPAALTSMAFMALGIALLSLAAPARLQAESTTQTSQAYILIFIILAAGIVTAGHLSHKRYEKRYRTEVEHQLTAVADLKVGEIMQWRKERLGDASLFHKNFNFSGLVQRYLQKPGDKETAQRLRTWLQHVQEGYQYDRVFLLDANGKERLSVPEARRPISRQVILRAVEALRINQVTFEDFYRNEYDRRVYLAVLIPILDERDNSRGLGTLVLRIDPEQYFYPFLKRWPTPSKTAETLLVRREGNEVLFLNELRFRKDTALNLRISLDRKEMPAVQASFGRQGIVEGRDYRGVPVIAHVRAVPGSPWFLASRMDISEVYGPVRERLWMMVVTVMALLIGSGAGVGLLWRQQSTRFYREKCAAADALRESEEGFRLLVDGVQDYAIFMLDPSGHVMSWNKGAERIKGYRSEEIIGRHFSRFYTEEDVQQGKPQRDLERAAAGRFEVEGWRIRKDGSRFWANAVISALRDETGRLRGFSKVTRDITERKKAEKELQDRNAELERFIYTVSHDLKSPVVTVKTFLGYLEEDLTLSDAGRIEKDVFYMRTAADKMGQLLDELLEMSRIGRVVDPPVNVTFRELVEETLRVVAGSIAERGVDVQVADVDITLHGDRSRLVEIWQNLVENAVKFMGEQPSSRIVIGAEGRGQEIIFSVCDNGIGVDPRYQGKVFSLFEKLDQKSEGTGLGLALVKRIVELYQGKIWLESEGTGHGACFRFTLPGAIMDQEKGERS